MAGARPFPKKTRFVWTTTCERRSENDKKMNCRLHIEFHKTRPNEEVEFRIRREFAHLEKFYDRLMTCRVDVEAPEHEHRGAVHKIRIDFGFPREDAKEWAELEGARNLQGLEHLEVKAQSQDPAMAVHAAFKAARRRLKDLVTVP